MVTSIYRGMGYLLNDDRASGGGKQEADMLGCKHCLRLMRKPIWQREGGFSCARCGPVCNACLIRIPTHGCENFMRRLEGALERQYQRDQLTKVLGV